MGGGLMQLVAYGAADIYLTGNPQITYFKVVYRRHTNFSIESIEQTFDGTVDFGRKVSCVINRNGDLIGSIYLQIVLPQITGSGTSNFSWNHYIGLNLINYVDIEIGGQRIDKHYNHWLYIWGELTISNSKQDNYNNMIGATSALNTVPNDSYTSIPESTLFIPLQFWFCKDPGLALPLISLQYHEVKINIEFESFINCIKGFGASTATALNIVSGKLLVDYIYLDSNERKRFAQVSHEYLIEQLQFTGDETVNGANNRVRLNFNHPVKELIWVVRKDSNVNTTSNASSFFNYGDSASIDSAYGSVSGGNNVVSNAKLQLNGHDRFAQRPGLYFNCVQPYYHHTSSPTTGINVYSFALEPEEHQPSGTCNFSRIDNAALHINTGSITTDAKIKVFALNYNILRIKSGMGGLVYSN